MQTFKVEEMSCGHCVSTVTKAVQSIDPQARVDADLTTGTVTVESSASHTQLAAIIEKAGYPVVE